MSYTTRSLPLNIGKIPRIQKQPLPLDQAKAAKSTKISLVANSLPRNDYLKIFKGLTVLFIGDNTIRTLYRDLCSVLQYDRLLTADETARPHGDYHLIENEHVLVKEGKLKTDEYRDIKEFVLTENSTHLIYIYIATIFNGIPRFNLEYLKTINQQSSIDMIVFCSYGNDFTKAKIQSSRMKSNAYFEKYLVELSHFLNYLKNFCRVPSKTQHFFWFTPLPQPFHASQIKEEQFERFLKVTTDLIIKTDDFISFDLYDIWKRRKDLTVPQNGYLSLHGIREVNDCFARFFANKVNRPFTSSIPPSITPLSHLNDKPSYRREWPKPTSQTSTKSDRYHPYSR
ncbi:unnamed protein product [Adineta ricciae]|uniref:Uncharacterized protein n=1 Tax=Adineta ricciae TaxID=249248 RepID=A0A815SX03_ADIRI|nr:unnamed protein product [Adineta ricciae]CAF1498590.1 unnamed protein product [Adineta ricciae]